MFQRLLYAFIGCHGLTDMYLSHDLWIPVYLMSVLYSHVLPYKLLVGVSYLLSVLHFSQDIFLFVPFHIRYLCYGSVLSYLILCRKRRWAQNAIIGYMGLIHTPIHCIRHVNSLNELPVKVVGGFIFTNPYLQTYINDIMRHGEIEHATRRNRCLLSVINAHIVTMILLQIR